MMLAKMDAKVRTEMMQIKGKENISVQEKKKFGLKDFYCFMRISILYISAFLFLSLI